MKLTGAEIFIECLKREGVKTVFALPGGVVLKIFDTLHQQKDVEVILTRHEQGPAIWRRGMPKPPESRSLSGHVRSRHDQCHYGIGRCVYGFSSPGLFQRTSSHESDRE